MSTQECRQRIVNHLRGRGWVPVAILAKWMRDELGLTIQQGDYDLRHLRLMGEIERRFSPIGIAQHYEYKAE